MFIARREEKDLRGRKQSMYSQVTKCIEEYDAVMTEKKTQHERRQKMHEDDLRQIQDYEEYFKQLEIEKAERAEKERIEAEKRAEEERAQKVLHDAAAKIQALFRGVQCRKELKKGAGKKGNKGKVRHLLTFFSRLRAASIVLLTNFFGYCAGKEEKVDHLIEIAALLSSPLARIENIPSDVSSKRWHRIS